jgi:hypothetical protein
MTATSTTKPTDLDQLTAAAERAGAEAQKASAAASAAHAEAQLAAERIRLEQDARFVRWAENRVTASGETGETLAAEVDAARLAFEHAVAAGDADFVARYLDWSTASAKLYYHRTHAVNLRGLLHQRRPDSHPAVDAGRSGGHDSRTSIPTFIDALARAVAAAAATRHGDMEDQLQAELQAALRGDTGGVVN